MIAHEEDRTLLAAFSRQQGAVTRSNPRRRTPDDGAGRWNLLREAGTSGSTAAHACGCPCVPRLKIDPYLHAAQTGIVREAIGGCKGRVAATRELGVRTWLARAAPDATMAR